MCLLRGSRKGYWKAFVHDPGPFHRFLTPKSAISRLLLPLQIRQL